MIKEIIELLMQRKKERNVLKAFYLNHIDFFKQINCLTYLSQYFKTVQILLI